MNLFGEITLYRMNNFSIPHCSRKHLLFSLEVNLDNIPEVLTIINWRISYSFCSLKTSNSGIQSFLCEHLKTISRTFLVKNMK